jgi:hypothetical protein
MLKETSCNLYGLLVALKMFENGDIDKLELSANELGQLMPGSFLGIEDVEDENK